MSKNDVGMNWFQKTVQTQLLRMQMNNRYFGSGNNEARSGIQLVLHIHH